MKLFEEQNYKVTITEEIRQIKEFKTIWTRDKGGKITGDPDGRLKYLAIAELSYVHFEAFYKSPYKKYSASERLSKLIRDLKLPQDWKPDAAVKAAIDKYNELQDTPATGFLMELTTSLNTTRDVLQILRERVEGRVDILRESTSIENENLQPLLDDIDRIIGMAGKVPKMLTELKKLTVEVEVEQSSNNRIKGNVKIDVYQTPERANRR